MTGNATTADILRRLQSVERQIATITAAAKYLPALEGRRDKLLAELLDLEGAHDQRVVAVR